MFFFVLDNHVPIERISKHLSVWELAAVSARILSSTVRWRQWMCMYKFTYFSVEKLIFIGKQDGITKKKKKNL